ncbi:unnamed protein product, partial [Staurois parvus]
MGPTTDPGPSGSARASKWSVCPWAVSPNISLGSKVCRWQFDWSVSYFFKTVWLSISC